MQLAGRAALVAVLLCAAGPVAHAALFDDEEARARIEAGLDDEEARARLLRDLDTMGRQVQQLLQLYELSQ